MIIEITLLVLLCILLMYIMKGDSRNYPPGPWGLPLIGTMLPSLPESARKMYNKYGKIFMLKMGSARFLFLADYEMAKEAFSLPEFSDRPKWRLMQSPKNDAGDRESLGLINSNGERWQHNRRFVLRNLRDLGMGKTRLEGAILYEVEDLVRHFSKMTEEPTEIPFALNISILNVIFQLIASHRYALDDQDVISFMKKLNKIQGGFFLQLIEDFFPFIKCLLPKSFRDKLLGFTQVDEALEHFYRDIRPYITEHKKTLDPNNPRDLIDDYLIAMEEEKEKKGTFFDDYDLLKCIFDLFLAGNDTTANMIKWIILYMAKYPSIQDRVQEEIDSVVSRDCLPNLEHRNSLAIVDALINEVSRISSFTSFGVLRATSSDINFRGYFIPKDTTVISLAFITHEDPKHWDNPEEFNPDRFLDSSGKFHMNKDGFQPFGLGRRQCLGESLARMELYLLTAALLQNFTFSPLPGREVDINPMKNPLLNVSKPQKLLIRKRK